MEPTPLNIEDKKAKNSSLFEKISFILILIFLAALPLLVLPQSIISFTFVKMGIATYTILGATILFLAQSISEGSILLKPRKVVLSLIALPIVAVVAAFVGNHPQGSFIGSGSEFDTVYFLFLGFVLVFLTSYIFKSKQRTFTAYVTFFISFIVVALIHLVRFLFGADVLHSGSLLPTIATNTVGAWNDFGAYAGLAVILSFITLELVSLSRQFKIILSIVLASSIILLGIANFYTIFDFGGIFIPATAVIGAVALFVFVYTVSANYKKVRLAAETTKSIKKVSNLPIPSLIVLVFAVIFTIGAQPITKALYNQIGISGVEVLDVRPTIQTTLVIANNNIHSKVLRALFGSGSSQFYSAWSLYKPQSINQSPFWNNDFNYGSGYIPTFLTTTGILGFLAWLFFLGTIFFYGIKGVFAGIKDKFSQYLIISSLLAAGYLWFLAFFTVTGPVVILLGFFFTGILFASLYREDVLVTKEISWVSSQKKGFLVVLLTILFIIGTIALGFTWTKHLSAAVSANKAVALVATAKDVDDIKKAEVLMGNAIEKDLSDTYLRSYAQLKLVELRLELQKANSAELTQQNAVILNDAILAGREAALNVNPTNYQNWILLGSIYESAGLLGVTDAGILARQSYEQARVLNPSNPLPELLLARLYVYAQDNQTAEAQVQLALQKKADFNEAYALLDQIKKLKPGSQQTTSPSKTSTSTATTTESVKPTSTATSTTSSSTQNR